VTSVEFAVPQANVRVLPPPPTRGRSTGRSWLPVAATGAALAAACAYVAAVDPNTSTLFPQCPLHAATGLDCPGCGATRATHALLHGDLTGALDHNALFVLALPLILLAMVNWFLRAAGRDVRPIRWSNWMTWVALVAVLGFFLVRNLPGFSYLRAGVS
jgi:hypothetical protein